MVKRQRGATQGSEPSRLTLCPICNGQVNRRVSADFAPFLQLRCQIPSERPAFANFCEACEHLFFTPFLTPQEITKLYTDYRGAEYLEQRLKTEPTYDEDHVYFVDDESKVRGEYYCHFLPEYRNTTGTILDFGGGDGRAARWAFPDAEIIVVDHDHQALGIDLQALAGRADLLLCAHVFEHVPDPVPLLTELISGMRQGTYVYLELPKEYDGRLANLFEQLEGQEAAEEPFRPVSQRRVHEHIAHFSKRSAQRLLLRAGARPIEVHHAESGIFGILAIVDGAPADTLPEPPTFPPRYPVLPYGQIIDFGTLPSLSRYLSFGWRKPEEGYVWSSGRRARLAIPALGEGGSVKLILSVNPLVRSDRLPSQIIEAWVNDRLADQTSVSTFSEAVLLLPRLTETAPYIELRFPDATTPKALGLSDDDSLLAVQLLNMRVEPIPILTQTWLSTGRGGGGQGALIAGWRPSEDGFTWSAARAATLVIDLGQTLSEVLIGMDMTPLVSEGKLDAQNLVISANGAELSRQKISERSIVEVRIPKWLAQSKLVRLQIAFPDATSPEALGLAADTSILAVQLHGLSVRKG